MAKKPTVLQSDELADLIIEAIEDNKGEDLVKMDLRKLDGAVTDFFVICTANSTTQVGGIKDSIEEKVRKKGNDKPWHVEGTTMQEWVLMDYVNVVVHIFLPERRAFFRLEDLWADAKISKIETAEKK